MHLTNDMVSAASYDVCSKEGSSNDRTPNAWSMEASADGLFWDLVHEVVSNTVSCSYRQWMSNGSKFTANAKRTGFAFGLDNGKSLLSPPSGQLANATVSVAPGAVLRAEGTVTIKSIAVDVAGAGTIDGFAVGAGGTVDVEGVAKIDGFTVLPITIAHASGTENFAGWGVSIGGKSYGAAKVVYANGRLAVVPPGCVIVIR